MAIKNSEVYSSLWASFDELRGGVDASRYKDYVLVLLFVKYISDRFAGQPYVAIIVPPGASFADMVALKDRPDIGHRARRRFLARPARPATSWTCRTSTTRPSSATATRWSNASATSSPS